MIRTHLVLALTMLLGLMARAAAPGTWVLALEGADPLAPRAVLVVESSPAGTLSAGAYLSLNDAKATPVDAAKLTRNNAALAGNVSLSRPPAKAGDPAVRCVYALDVTLGDGKADGTYTGTEGEAKVAGKVTWGADRLPLGHPLFCPSAARPVGFRGDGTNIYAGATLVPSFDERSGKNVLWKVEVPAWSSSGLIAVGDKLFTTGEPYSLFCFSATDGKLLWQRELNPFASAGLSGEKLAQATELYEVVAALRLIGYHMMGTRTPAEWDQALAHIDKLKAIAAAWAPDSGPGFDNLKVAYAEFRNGKDGGRQGGIEHAYAKHVKLPAPMGVPLTHVWYNMVGFTFATPVSDGQHVYATMGQGQVGCFDLEGNLIWTRYVRPDERRNIELRANHVPSPLLIDGLLVGQMENKLVAFDAKTGEVRWEDAKTRVGGGYNVGTHRVLRLAVPDGAPMAVIVTTGGRVLRARDGKPLADLGVRMCGSEGGGSSPAGLGNVIVFEQGGNNGGEWKAFELTATDADTVAAKELWTGFRPNSREATIPLPERFIKVGLGGGRAYDPRTGEVLFKLGRQSAPKGVQIGGETGATSVLVGDTLLLTHGGADGYSRGKDNPTQEVWVNFATATLDGRILSPVNVLGGLNRPRYPLMEKYLPEWYAQLAAFHHEFLPCQFAFTASGPIAVGDRLYIRSASHLYCIGSSLTAANEMDLAAARALTEVDVLVTKLGDASPAIRREAATRLGALADAAKPAVERLKAVAGADPYGAVRAAAVLALDAIDPAGKPGMAALHAKVGTTFSEWMFDREVAETLTALGEPTGLPMVAPLLTDKDPKVIGSAALAMRMAGWNSDATRDALLAALPRNPRHVSNALSSNWRDDPKVIAAHRAMLLGMKGGLEAAWTMYAHVRQVTPSAERAPFMVTVAKGNSDAAVNAVQDLTELRPVPAEAMDAVTDRRWSRSAPVVHALIRLLGSTAPADNRIRAAEALGRCGVDANYALAALKKAADDPDAGVAAAAKAAVAALEAAPQPAR